MTINCATRSLNASISTTNRTNFLVETVIETILDKTTEETGVLEQGEIITNILNTNAPALAVQGGRPTSGRSLDGSAISSGSGRDSGRRAFNRNTGENEPYDMSTAL